MRQFFPVEDLARDERFVQTNMAERMKDGRTAIELKESSAKSRGATKRLTPERHDASDFDNKTQDKIQDKAQG